MPDGYIRDLDKTKEGKTSLEHFPHQPVAATNFISHMIIREKRTGTVIYDSSTHIRNISDSFAANDNLVQVLGLALIKDLEHLLGQLDATQGHGAEGGPHAVGTVNLRQLHTTDEQAGHNLTRALHDSVLGSVHVKTAHATKLLDALHAHKALDRESTHGTVMASSGDDDGGVDGVGVLGQGQPGDTRCSKRSR